MSFIVADEYLHHPRPLGLHALKLRLALLLVLDAYQRGQTEPVDPRRPIGCRLPTVDVRRMIGLGSANDARALRRAAADLHDDPAFQRIEVSEDGRHVSFVVVPDIFVVGFVERYALLDEDDIRHPQSVTSFHLWMRYAAVRRMAAPHCTVPPEGVAAMAGPGRRPDLAWARRTLMPAAQRLAARIAGPVVIAGAWPADPATPPTLRLRFGGPDTRWRQRDLAKVRPLETTWIVEPDGVSRVSRSRITPILGDAPAWA